MGTTMAPPTQAAYLLPQQPTFTFPPQPPPTQIHVPQQQGWAAAAGGKRHTEGNASTEARNQDRAVEEDVGAMGTTMTPACAPNKPTAIDRK
eukprot:scaffold155026_cov54-Attheya_sp.AAC.2